MPSAKTSARREWHNWHRHFVAAPRTLCEPAPTLDRVACRPQDCRISRLMLISSIRRGRSGHRPCERNASTSPADRGNGRNRASSISWANDRRTPPKPQVDNVTVRPSSRTNARLGDGFANVSLIFQVRVTCLLSGQLNRLRPVVRSAMPRPTTGFSFASAFA